MRQAIRKVRDALGPDAVILSNRTIEEGVEVVAAIDYDESLLDTVPGAKPNKPAHQHAEKEINRDAIWDDVRYARNIPASAKAKAAAKQPVPDQAVNVKLSDDPTFMQMQSELKSLRGLLVNAHVLVNDTDVALLGHGNGQA